MKPLKCHPERFRRVRQVLPTACFCSACWVRASWRSNSKGLMVNGKLFPRIISRPSAKRTHFDRSETRVTKKMTMTKKIGFIGLGIMGGGMAGQLLTKGFEL